MNPLDHRSPQASHLFLREEQMRQAQDLLFFAYRDFTAAADRVLEKLELGRAHHRAIHFIGRTPGISVGDLLHILRITKQSLGRVLTVLIENGYVAQSRGTTDARQRHLSLTETGIALERLLFERQRETLATAYLDAGAPAVEGFRRVMRGIMDNKTRAPARPDRRQPDPPAQHAPEPIMTEETHVLVVDDDARLRALLSRYLVEQGFRVTTASQAADARDKLRIVHPDLLVLDVMMPDETGLSLTHSLRAAQRGSDGTDIPILLLTARGAPEDRIAGFEAGADDYLHKPFEPYELVLRLRAMLRRRTPAPITDLAPTSIRLGPLEFDIARGELAGPAGIIHLTGAEAALLQALAARPGDVLSREAIVDALQMDETGERAIDVQVTRLRRKIEADPREPRFLHTVRGRGYILKPGI